MKTTGNKTEARGGPCLRINDEIEYPHMSPLLRTIPAWDGSIFSRSLDFKVCGYRVAPALAYPARWGPLSHGPVLSP